MYIIEYLLKVIHCFSPSLIPEICLQVIYIYIKGAGISRVIAKGFTSVWHCQVDAFGAELFL